MNIYIIYLSALAAAILIMLALNKLLYYMDREEPEIFDAILNADELERHAIEIARNHAVGKKSKVYSLEARMNKNFRLITSVYKSLNDYVNGTKQITPAAEWLLDNFYIIEEQVKEIRLNLSRQYYYQLPRLKGGSLKGYPRVYAIALELVSHTDGRFDDKLLTSFVRAYQSHALLSSGELWAIPLMVRMALIENIRHVCERIMESQQQWYKAEKLADLLLLHKEKKPDELLALAKENMRHMERISTSYGEHLLNRLKKHGLEIAQIIQYLDERLSEQHATGESIAHLEHKEQAARQVSMGNSITGLRLISTLDWTEVFEQLSQVEQILRQDPDNIYGQMDFSSRDYYRHEIEKLSKKLKISEIQVAKKVIECAVEDGKHAGHYLLGRDRQRLLSRMGCETGKNISPAFLFLGGIVLLTCAITFGLCAYAYAAGLRVLQLPLVAAAVVIPASDIALAIVNWLIVHVKEPAFLPKLELKEGIPESAKTIVVIPTLLPNEQRALKLLEQLEEYYLANKEKNLCFSLLGDFKDGKNQTEMQDDAIIKAVSKKIDQLNGKYALEAPVFFYFHRRRIFSKAQGKWMGWERKRGAIIEFNDLIRDAGDTTFCHVSGDIAALKDVEYVITIDADTKLPMEAAKKLVGTILHPLNRAVVDEEKGIVTRGYGLLQPRINVDIVSANATRFSRIFAGQGGIDIYTNAISDVYMDLFGEGIFTGKGIYQLDVFQRLLKNTLPENAVLSHDLIEGSYIRTGLVTDIELIDGYPSRYNAFSMRLHRWVRGDWQLIPWLARNVASRSGQRVRNPLTVISKWKIFDNLRRSLSAPSATLLFLLSVSILPGNPVAWTAFTLLSVVFPSLIGVFDTLLSKYSQKFKEKNCCSVTDRISVTLYQALLILAFLPYQAYLMLDAVIRTLHRVLISKRNMLEWVTAADMELGLKNDAKSFWRRMWMCPSAGAACLLISLLYRQESLLASILLLSAWGFSPSIAYWVSKPGERKQSTLTAADLAELRKIARKTWNFFEDFVGAPDNYLPPDNYQENPPNGIAHRTSPTNIGLFLVSIMAARDFGYISTTEMLDRLEHSIATIEKLKKWKGHLYNWYDTISLEVLRPSYISTVDSGNFVGYLMALRQGLLEYREKPMLDRDILLGLKDTIALLNEEQNQPAMSSDIFEELLQSPEPSLSGYYSLFKQLSEMNELRRPLWGYKLYKAVSGFMHELENVMPWITRLDTLASSFPEQSMAIGRLAVSTGPAGFARGCKAVMLELDQSIKGGAGKNKNRPDKPDTEFRDALEASCVSVQILADRIDSLYVRVNTLIEETHFHPLFDSKRKLFSIGYNEEEEQLTKSYYDLLASEARQASFIAIAKGEIKKEHWFMLDRTLTAVDGHKGLLSWTGTMFEYMMPLLVMKDYCNTLLNETYHFVMKCQKEYGYRRKVPWGVSESGYYSFDFRLNYQYKAFGIPALGLKRGLINDTVIAPYATLLALMVQPVEAMVNIQALKAEGLDSPYGFYEAVDYTPERLKRGKKSSIVKSFMAHHQGMSFIALNNLLYGNIMQERFHREPIIKAAELLLQEKIPSKVIFAKDYKEKIEPFLEMDKEEVEYSTVLSINNNTLPEAHILSNGDYAVMITDNGSGYSRYQHMAVTRWREDSILNQSGMFFYIQNVETNEVWSTALNPTNILPSRYKVVFSQDKAVFFRTDGEIDTQTEIIVSTEDDVEIRRISLTNHSLQAKVLEVTSYLESVLTSQAADLAHAAFSNLFIRTEFLSRYNAILAVRRPREESHKHAYAFHALTMNEEIIGGIQYETDRSKFLGRGYTLQSPLAMESNHPLSNTTGPVIDPIMSLRCRIRLQPGQTVKINYITGVSEKRDRIHQLAEKYHDPSSIDRAFELAWTRSQVEMRYLNLKREEIELYRQMIAQIVYISPLRRKYDTAIRENKKGQPGLWSFGISGDLPIVLVSITKADEADLVKDMLKAHEYWRLKGLFVDVIIMNEDEGSYTQPLFNLIQDIVSISHARDLREKPGGIFIRQGSILSEEDKLLLTAAARIIVRGKNGSLSSQVKIRNGKYAFEYKPWKEKPRKYEPDAGKQYQLLYFNGYGGFTQDGREYVTRLTEGLHTPLPWTNVIANKDFGFIITESGSSCTWSENSRENKLTTWSNDPVADTPGEILYLRDDETGELWTVTPGPIRDMNTYFVRHGFGYTVFEHNSHGLEQSLLEFVPVRDPVKIMVLKLKNQSEINRALSATFYMRPVMGVSEYLTAQYVYTELLNNETLLIRNNYNSDFPGRITFIDTNADIRYVTGDRREFLGNNGTIRHPEALRLEKLTNNVGAGMEPCASMQVKIELKPNEEREIVFLLGQGRSLQEVRDLTLRYKDRAEAESAFEEVRAYWGRILTTVQVKTPDTTMDLLLNGWLLYQTIVCRLFARTAFYQSGGAYGFRDQLQDSIAVINTMPELTRSQILYHAAHQFLEGDVQHWWHPGTDKGIRTRFSDDLLWLPYTVAEYINATQDWKILDQEAYFLDEESLREGEDERYNRPYVSEIRSSLYDHCIRAIERALKFGQHGIPLMGSGDWNDGMSTVGNKGKGESVWLGWFLYSILLSFADICKKRRDQNKAERYLNIAREIAKALEENAWDGNWYRRAYFDNGLPLGSAENTECKIDSLAQTWSIISGAGNADRSKEAMKAVEQYLVRKDEGLILLLTPPFDEGDLHPGYIKGYIPGVRENGGQYTHAAIWVILAYAKLGCGDRAWELFNLLNPVNHANTPFEAARYKVEPYVVAADVYAVYPHTGRGGWTWYTGAAGWMYRVGLHNILGFNRLGGKLLLDPCIPKEWSEFKILYRYADTTYDITVKNPTKVNRGVNKILLDGDELPDKEILLTDDGRTHEVELIMG